VLTHIWGNVLLLILPEEKQGNSRAIHGHCAHSHLNKLYTAHSTWGKSRNARAIHGHCAHSHLKECYTANSTWGKSRETQFYTWTLCSFTFEAMLYCLILPEEIHEKPKTHCYIWTLWPLTFEVIVYCVNLVEENLENPRPIHGHCAHSRLKHCYTA
jgi:hypothetical protein